MSFKAVVITKDGDKQVAQLTELDNSFLRDGDVEIAVEFSAVNFKDGMVLRGVPPFIQKAPIIPGIDLAGTVTASSDSRFAVGDKVVATGYGLGVAHHGGFSQRARLPADWLVRLPDAISTRQAMAIGTAGFTAMLSVLALEHQGLQSGRGPVLVTGASGGVGSVAVTLLAKLGYEVHASTGRPQEEAYLKGLGAQAIVDRNSLSQPGKPMGAERWAAAVDCVGSQTLVNVLAQIRYGGAVTACGLAQGMDLPASMAPFILRGVTLVGIDSVNALMAHRQTAWSRLARDLDLAKLEALSTVVGLHEAVDVAAQVMGGKVRGRTVVDVHA